jgi:hypothetical protein
VLPASLIFVERGKGTLKECPSPREGAMKLHMDEPLLFWIDEDKKYEKANRTRAELIAEILREYERHGDAMRYLNVKGKIAWKASSWMLLRRADVVREAKDDMADFP